MHRRWLKRVTDFELLPRLEITIWLMTLPEEQLTFATSLNFQPRSQDPFRVTSLQYLLVHSHRQAPCIISSLELPA